MYVSEANARDTVRRVPIARVAFEGRAEGVGVSPFQITAGRQAARRAGNAQPQRGKIFQQQKRRRLALGIRVRGQNDFVDRLAFNTSDKFVDFQVFAVHPFERRDMPMQHVVETAIAAGALDGQYVERLFHHTDLRAVAALAHADRAVVAGGDIEAAFAERHLLLHLYDRLGQHTRLLIAGAQQEKGEPGCGFGANAGQTAERIDQACHWLDDQPIRIVTVRHSTIVQRHRAHSGCPVPLYLC
ncbi:hypothetical protein HC891_19470 [Candidatus Gracilibacteria bacterium]|nr:hypothetical protein [Candidatus Gracilibacteria bacterium]